MEWLKHNAIAAIMLLGSMGVAYGSLTSRISVIESEVLNAKEEGSKLERRMDRQLDRIETKLDKVLEVYGKDA